MESFVIYQLMFLIIEEMSEDNKDDNIMNFLIDANPFMRQGEASVEEVIYDEFKRQYALNKKEDDYCYEFICGYLKQLDSYYGDIFSIFNQLSREEYINSCKNILENYSSSLKK